MLPEKPYANANACRLQRKGEIGGWSKGEISPELILDLPEWATSHGVEGVVWTGLPSKFKGEERRTPKMEEVVEYLRSLTGSKRDNAEGYIRHAPPQIDTPYRRGIEAALQWTFRPRD